MTIFFMTTDLQRQKLFFLEITPKTKNKA